jgi:hypothetical protein
MTQKKPTAGNSKLDAIVAEARRNQSNREQGYREKSLKMYPWVCGRCSREFTRENLHELTVHHVTLMARVSAIRMPQARTVRPPLTTRWQGLVTY